MLNLLKNAFASGKASHAYIVVGEKPNIPALLNQCAQVVMCNTHTATDNCERCLKVAQGIHQDVISIPTDLTKNRTTVADVSYLVDETYKRPVDNSLSRVFLVNAVDSVAGIGCEIWQNKLLKTLEEPTAGCYIFIGVTDAESLLPTVRSRCQVLKQSKVPQSQIEQKLQSGGLDVLVCQMVAAMCGGSLSSAERLISNAQVVKSYQVALDTAENMTSTKNALPFAWSLGKSSTERRTSVSSTIRISVVQPLLIQGFHQIGNVSLVLPAQALRLPGEGELGFPQRLHGGVCHNHPASVLNQ